MLLVFAQRIAFRFVLPQESGLPRRFAPRNDMQKSAGRLRLQERSTRGNAQKVRIRRRYFLFVLSYRRRADCPVASLLAMTCNNLLPVRTMPGHWRYAAGKAPLHPHPRLFLLHVIANQWNMGKPHCGFPQPLRPVTHHCTSCKIFSPVQKLGVDKLLPMWYSNLAVRAK